MSDGVAPDVLTSIVDLTKLLRRVERNDLAERTTAAGARLKRPSTIVCVVGEFKQGKSSLVNGLLGQHVCPVDDDLATSSITLVRYGEKPGAVVRRKVDGEQVAERVQIEELDQWVSEVGNPDNVKNVERVEISVPAAVLKQGLVLADTPGMGGIGAGHAAATLAFLPFADGLILTSDASAELSAPEIEFLARACELCPTVLFVQTKTDLYPSWERIFDLNRGHLEGRGLKIPMIATSAALRFDALQRKDRDLNALSKFPELLQRLGDDVITPARATAEERSANDVRSVAGLVRSGLAEERQLLADPTAVKEAVEKIEAAKVRLEHLRGPGARWSVLVGDRVTDLSSLVSHDFRGAMRGVNQELDGRIEVLTKGAEWDEVGRGLQTSVADQVTEAFLRLENGRGEIRAAVIELLDEEKLVLGASNGGGPNSFDVSEMWRGKSIDDSAGAKAAFKTGLIGARGAQGGVMMFGMMGNFLPGALAAFMATNPVLLSAGAVFGSIQLIEDRKRKLTMRRQSARQQVRQFVDDVQFEVTNEIAILVRDIQRDLRDEFTHLLADLQRTYTTTAQNAQASAKSSQEERKARGEEIAALIAELDAIESAVVGATS
jgi:hypothetical protein